MSFLNKGKGHCQKCKLPERGYYPMLGERVDGPRTYAGLVEDHVEQGWRPY